MHEPRRQGNRFAWCSEAKATTVVSGGRAEASRFSASVVFRVRMTLSSRRAPANSPMAARDDSSNVVLTADANPAPRLTLAYHGSALAIASCAARRHGGLAAQSRL